MLTAQRLKISPTIKKLSQGKGIFFHSIVFPPVRTKYKEERRKKRREEKQSEIVSSDFAMLRERKSNAHEAGYPQLLLQTRPG